MCGAVASQKRPWKVWNPCSRMAPYRTWPDACQIWVSRACADRFASTLPSTHPETLNDSIHGHTEMQALD